jgi:hypothetical protein
VEELRPRIDKLYMALNARARGDDRDFEDDPAEPWNRLVELLVHVLVKLIANTRWAVEEHREADRLRDEVSVQQEALQIFMVEAARQLAAKNAEIANLRAEVERYESYQVELDD